MIEKTQTNCIQTIVVAEQSEAKIMVKFMPKNQSWETWDFIFCFHQRDLSIIYTGAGTDLYLIMDSKCVEQTTKSILAYY